MADPRAHPINRVTADAHLSYLAAGVVRIAWEIRDDFCERAKYFEYDVIVGRSPTDQFTKIATVTDRFYDDPEQRQLDHSLSLYYALRVRDKRTGDVWYTPPVRVGCKWQKEDWRIAREISRAFRKRLGPGRAGTRGYLLKRRNFGPPCEECVDPVTGQIATADCQACWGTGIEGGYYDPIEAWVEASPERVMRKLDGQQGMMSEVLSDFTALAYPPFEPNDYWKDATSGLIYKVKGDLATVAHLRLIPVLQRYRVDVEQRSAIIYEYPFPDG